MDKYNQFRDKSGQSGAKMRVNVLVKCYLCRFLVGSLYNFFHIINCFILFDDVNTLLRIWT